MQEVYRTELIHSPIRFCTPPNYTSAGLEVNSCDGATYRGFLHLKTADGCVPQCCLRSNGDHILFIPAIDWGRYERNCTLPVMLGPEVLFLRHAFRIIKCQFGYNKTVYRGLKKNWNRPYAMFACANLYSLSTAGRKLSTT